MNEEENRDKAGEADEMNMEVGKPMTHLCRPRPQIQPSMPVHITAINQK